MRFGHPLAARGLKHSILGELRGVGIGADGHRDDDCPRGFRRAASRLSIAAAGEQATLTQLAVRVLRDLTIAITRRTPASAAPLVEGRVHCGVRQAFRAHSLRLPKQNVGTHRILEFTARDVRLQHRLHLFYKLVPPTFR